MKRPSKIPARNRKLRAATIRAMQALIVRHRRMIQACDDSGGCTTTTVRTSCDAYQKILDRVQKACIANGTVNFNKLRKVAKFADKLDTAARDELPDELYTLFSILSEWDDGSDEVDKAILTVNDAEQRVAGLIDILVVDVDWGEVETHASETIEVLQELMRQAHEQNVHQISGPQIGGP
ncbi:hypothetical protein LCGC14_0709920 [marine sediment metagenome]|uniref:Uncharacterized protein n=1 Tax=marine sediment metagenome TaxID=412755 RepID=A0A0F9R0X0_9ZZZZ